MGDMSLMLSEILASNFYSQNTASRNIFAFCILRVSRGYDANIGEVAWCRVGGYQITATHE